MDETYDQMQSFLRALQDFDNHLRNSVSDMNRCHEVVAPLWQDSFRREYDARWEQFLDFMAQYLNRESVDYEQYLYDKLIQIRSYLYGN